MSIQHCPFCVPDTAGRHSYGCPNDGQSALPASGFPLFFNVNPDKLAALDQKITQALEEFRGKVSIEQARMVFWEAFEKDPNLKDGYVSNVAMLLHDRLGEIDPYKRNQLANEILDLLFKP